MSYVSSAGVALLLLSPVLQASPGSVEQNWTNTVRIGAYGLRSDNARRRSGRYGVVSR